MVSSVTSSNYSTPYATNTTKTTKTSGDSTEMALPTQSKNTEESSAQTEGANSSKKSSLMDRLKEATSGFSACSKCGALYMGKTAPAVCAKCGKETASQKGGEDSSNKIDTKAQTAQKTAETTATNSSDGTSTTGIAASEIVPTTIKL